MRKIIELKLLPKDAADDARIIRKAAEFCRLNINDIDDVHLLKRSIDARGAQPFVRIRAEVYSGESYPGEPAFLPFLKDVSGCSPALIIGAGPAGYFAALELIERGVKPIVFDRGKDVRSRRKDLRAIQQFGEVNPNSNYCFGEGGAGTYSDGKLYTRSHKRGHIFKAMKIFVELGAKPDILVDAHPHIGSNKLPQIIANLRKTILHHGGEIHFESCITDFIMREKKMAGVIVNDREEFRSEAVVLATGHSARDIYHLLHSKNIKIEAKPFALGVRIEHPQSLIDKIQYRQTPRDEFLPASSYKLVCQVGGRGVFSFCMCPGGLVVPTATAPGEIVLNGMSMSRRDSPFANSGTVVQVELEDLNDFDSHGVFKALAFQQMVEQSVYNVGGGGQNAPAQRLPDFINGKISSTLPATSYIPGVYSAPLHEILPGFIYEKLKTGVQEFGRKMRGYYTEEANVIATESRTSAPVRIPRNKETFMHVEVEGLFPCGEGAGYAGGIISAALDGQNVAKAVTHFIKK